MTRTAAALTEPFRCTSGTGPSLGRRPPAVLSQLPGLSVPASDLPRSWRCPGAWLSAALRSVRAVDAHGIPARVGSVAAITERD